MVKRILRLEGLLFFTTALLLYQQISGNWLVFALLILIPDVSMIGYLKSKQLGARIYNLGHNYILAFAVLVYGFLAADNFIVSLGLILTAHVGMDRFFGFGLKYSSNFKDTHIQKV